MPRMHWRVTSKKRFFEEKKTTRHPESDSRSEKEESNGGLELPKTSEEVWQMRENHQNRAFVCACFEKQNA